jgi:hypothetical protein
MPTDTPATIDDATRAFCATIAPGEPVFVDVEPGPEARVAYCFDNAAAAAAAGGGEVVHGWIIWRWPGRWFEAEHHAVWRTPDGSLRDVTPMLYGQRRILFLPDEGAVFDPANYRPNRLAAESGNVTAAEYVTLAAERAAIMNAYGEPGLDDYPITPEDRARLAEIEPRWTALYAELLQDHRASD